FTFDANQCCGGLGGGVATTFGENLGGANTGTLMTQSFPNPDTTMMLDIGGIPDRTTRSLFFSTPTVLRRAVRGATLLPTARGRRPAQASQRRRAGGGGWPAEPGRQAAPGSGGRRRPDAAPRACADQRAEARDRRLKPSRTAASRR